MLKYPLNIEKEIEEYEKLTGEELSEEAKLLLATSFRVTNSAYMQGYKDGRNRCDLKSHFKEVI